MTASNKDYIAYMLRLWRAGTKDEPVWRASLESPETPERQAFADLEELFAFLRENTQYRALDNDNGDPSDPK